MPTDLLVKALRTSTRENAREAAMTLVRQADPIAVDELKKMAMGSKRGLFKRYSPEHRLIALEALGETKDAQALDWLRSIAEAAPFASTDLQAAIKRSLEILEETTSRYYEKEEKFRPGIQKKQGDHVQPTISDIMHLRLDGIIPWNRNYYSISAIACAGGSSGRFKIVRKCYDLMDRSRSAASVVVKENVTLYGARVAEQGNVKGLTLTEAEYDSLPGPEFISDSVYQPAAPETTITKHEGWLELVGNSELLGVYTQETFKKVYDAKRETKAMAFLIPRERGISMLAPWSLGDVEYHQSWACVASAIYGHWRSGDPRILWVRPDLLNRLPSSA